MKEKSKGGGPGLFPVAENDKPGNILQYRNTGIIPYQGIRAMIQDGDIAGLVDIEDNQIQPASLDLRLGARAYRVRASFLPGPDTSVMEKIEQLDGLPPIELAQGAVFEKGAVYLAEIEEHVRLTGDVSGVANPKSSTGRLDILTRLVTDGAAAFDRIEKGYRGALYVEIAPLTFTVVVRRGSRLTQLRLQRGKASLSIGDITSSYEAGRFVRSDGDLLPLRDGLVPVSVDLRADQPGGIVGYRAKKNSNKIDVDKSDHYDPSDFWDPIKADQGRLYLDRDDFYILGTREEVGVPPRFAAEMVPIDPVSGEFRVHYAGFFDPGFGWLDGKVGGSKAVLEVRSYGVPFTLEHGQVVGWLRYSPVANGKPDKIYGHDLNSHYQSQGIALSKHFKPAPPG